MSNYTYYDPKLIKPGLQLERYPSSVDPRTQIIALITKEGMTFAVDVSNSSTFSVFSQECCQNNRHDTKAPMKLYSFPRSVLKDKESEKVIQVPEKELNGQRVGAGVGR